MNNKNTGIKVTVVILAILCLMMMGEITSLNDQVEQLNNDKNNLEMRVMDAEQILYDLQAQNESVRLADASYKIAGPDWEAGVIKVDFTVTPINMDENMSVFIGNTNEKIRLEKSGNVYVGTVNYPIDTEYYETIMYIYSGDVAVESETIDWIGAGNWASNIVAYKEDFYTSYGNNRLTVAGVMVYKLLDSEKVVNAKMVFMDEVIELENAKENSVEFNFSGDIDESLAYEDIYIEEMYVELEMESGKIYRIYPMIDSNLWYELGNEERAAYSIHQTEQLTVILPGGETYNMGLAVNDVYFE